MQFCDILAPTIVIVAVNGFSLNPPSLNPAIV